MDNDTVKILTEGLIITILPMVITWLTNRQMNRAASKKAEAETEVTISGAWSSYGKTLRDDYDQLKLEVDALKAQLTENETYKKDLEVKNTVIQIRVNDLETMNGSLSTRVVELEREVGDMITGVEILTKQIVDLGHKPAWQPRAQRMAGL